MTPDIAADMFDRLTMLERAQFLHASAERRHAEALDRHQALLDAHEVAHVDHAFRMAHLETMIDRQQRLQEHMLDLQAQLTTHQDDHAERLARLEEITAKVQLTLDTVLEMLRHRNGH